MFCSNSSKCVENEQFKGATFVHFKALKRCLLAFYAVSIDKYGESEKVIGSPMLQYFKEEGLIDKEYDWTYNYWRFKNGIIKLYFNSIIYQSDAVVSYIAEQKRNKEQNENLMQQRIKREQEYLDSVAKEQARKDSIQWTFNYDNVLNEI